MDILQVGKETCFKGAKLKRKLSLVSFPLAPLAPLYELPGTNCPESATEGQVAFSYSLPSPPLCV